MERRSGGRLSETLNSHYRTGIPDESIVSRILLDVVNGLITLHDNKLAHRNIRVSSLHYCKDTGITLLSEFGFLQEISDSSKSGIVDHRETVMGWGRRSDPYLAPECYQEFEMLKQKLKKSDQSDSKISSSNDNNNNKKRKDFNYYAIDIYALGVTALTLAFGEPPPLKKDLSNALFDAYDRKNPFTKKFEDFVNKCCRKVKL